MLFQPTGPTTIWRSRVAPPHDADRLGRQAVPFLGRQLGVRFIEQLQSQRGREAFVVFGDLPPKGEEPRAVLVRFREDFVVVMHVHHRREPLPQHLADRPVHAGEELRVDPVGRRLPGMGGPAHRYPHGVEAGGVDLLEILLFEDDAPLAFFRGLQGVAEVDAAAKDGPQLAKEWGGQDGGIRRAPWSRRLLPAGGPRDTSTGDQSAPHGRPQPILPSGSRPFLLPVHVLLPNGLQVRSLKLSLRRWTRRPAS